MEWKIIDSLVSATTGTFFAAASSPRNINLILWYQSDFFLRSGHTLSTSSIGIVINGHFRKLNILHTFPFTTETWTNLIQKTGCPGNAPNFKGPCLNITSCQFNQCPYDIKKYNSDGKKTSL
ncbi:anti-adapter protein iraM [Pseudescherichia sp.]|uniref:anti-adapter protein iraM n=1 Tax=Pseudescherichia sp. TaxID=2055881 RepID=UPI002899D07E|nr:anti-adapter protein iraM [Pseudescherichia sp.]